MQTKERIEKDYNEYKNGKRIQITVVHKPYVDLCMRVDLPLDKNKLWKISTGPPGLGFAGRREPWRAAGRGPRAAGLLLAKPVILSIRPFLARG